MSIHILIYSSHLNFDLHRNTSQVPVNFTTFFAVPTIRFHRLGRTISGVEFTYPPVRRWDLSHASSYSCPFLIAAIRDTNIRGVFFENASGHDLPSYCKEDGQGTPLEHSVFTDDMWVALYRVADYALSNYRWGWGSFG